MCRIKMIALDLDGTLLTDGKDITPYTRGVLTRAMDQGIHIVIATGRTLTAIPPVVRQLRGIRYAITANGARVADLETGETLWEQLLSEENAKKALAVFRKYDTLQEIYYDGQGYADEEKVKRLQKYHRDPGMWAYFLETRKQVPDIQVLMEREHRAMDKVQALFADIGDREQARQELSQFSEMEVVASMPFNLEVNTIGVEKGGALLRLGEWLAIPPEQIMACGDGDNDVSMLQKAGLGVAMGNGEDCAMEAADVRTTTNEKDGVAKAILKFAL